MKEPLVCTIETTLDRRQIRERIESCTFKGRVDTLTFMDLLTRSMLSRKSRYKGSVTQDGFRLVMWDGRIAGSALPLEALFEASDRGTRVVVRATTKDLFYQMKWAMLSIVGPVVTAIFIVIALTRPLGRVWLLPAVLAAVTFVAYFIARKDAANLFAHECKFLKKLLS